MKNVKRFGVIIIALVLVLSLGNVAFATTTGLTDGEVGSFSQHDTPIPQDKDINIKKELTVYNVDENTINAPTISYSYAVSAGPANIPVTDDANDHANTTAVTAYTKEGILTGLKVNGVAGTRGTISWNPDETVSANTNGSSNYKDLNLDFTDVVFTAAGIYRYTITETEPDYEASGVTVTDNDTNPHVRYLDVYVKPDDEITSGGTVATDWVIYGYVCVLESEEIDPTNDTLMSGAVKTDGFVAGTNDGEPYSADSYYTYNVTVSKTVTNDAYAKATHSFPFTVLFTNDDITQPVDISSSTTGTTGGFTDPASNALSLGTTNGVVTIKDSSSVKYIGIPNGTQVEVYETNDMSGVTYQVTTVANTNGTLETTTDAAVTDGSTPDSAVAQNDPKAAYQSTKTSFTPTVNADDDVIHTIAVDNNLQVISPTGLVMRFAPYALILVAGIVLLIIALKRKSRKNDDD